MSKVLIDTNVLIYSVEKGESRKNEKAIALIDELITTNRLAVSVQNIVEFSRVLLEKVSPPQKHDDVIKYVCRYLELSYVIRYDGNTVIRAVSIAKEYKIHFFDALLVATMQENGIEEIITENTEDFRKIQWLKVKNPFG